MSDRISTWSDEFKNAQRLQTRLDQTQDVAYTARQEIRELQRKVAELQRDVAALTTQVATTDVKARLTQFDAARRIREAAEAAVAAIAADRVLPADLDVSELDDEPGYWLAPLTRALPGLLADRPDEALLAKAAARDERRTATFLTAAALVLGRPEQARAWLPAAMAPIDAVSSVTAAQRVFLLVAAEIPESAAVTELDGALHAMAAAATATDRASLVDALASRVPGTGSTATSASTSTPAARLAGWGQLAEQLSMAAQAGPPPSFRSASLLVGVLRSLVVEGAPGEQALLDQVEPARADLVDLPGQKPRGWNAPIGTVLAVLITDLDPARRRLARRALAEIQPQVLQAVDRLGVEAANAVPVNDVVRIQGLQVTITERGPESADWIRQLEAGWLPVRSVAARPAFVAGCVVAVLAVIAALTLGPLWWIAVTLVGGGLVGALVADRRRVDAIERDRAGRRTDAKQAVSSAVSSFAEKVSLAQQEAEGTKLAAGRIAALVVAAGQPSA